jgi:hypothetical protein
MRADTEVAGAPETVLDRVPPQVQTQPRAPRIDRFDLSVLAIFGLVSLWVLGLDLWHLIVGHRVWTGTDGVYIVDQQQYLSWIRDAANHGLSSNLYVLHSTPHDYFQPAVLISAGLTALGMAPWLALLLWKPVAVVTCFWAARSFARRSLTGVWPRRAALVLILFFGCFTVIFGSVGVLGDLWPGFLSWGYTYGLMALAALVGALLTYDRASGDERISWLPGLLGAAASLLHPWQGEALIALLVAGEVVLWRTRPLTRSRGWLAVVTIGLTALPLLYYVILTRADLAWHLARESSKHSFPFGAIVISILPLMIPAALAYRQRPRTFLAAATRCWPLVAFGVYVVSGTGVAATPLHSFQGITFPLSVLAIEGLQGVGFHRIPRARLVGGILVAAFAIPATGYELYFASTLAKPTAGNGNFITADERDALTYLARNPTSGGVVAKGYLGATVPGITGRNTLLGDCLWSEPHCTERSDVADRLFDGTLDRTTLRTLLTQTDARFVLADCTTKANLRRELGALVKSERRFRCAAVYELAGSRSGPRDPDY